jgi:hypothetical protein
MVFWDSSSTKVLSSGSFLNKIETPSNLFTAYDEENKPITAFGGIKKISEGEGKDIASKIALNAEGSNPHIVEGNFGNVNSSYDELVLHQLMDVQASLIACKQVLMDKTSGIENDMDGGLLLSHKQLLRDALKKQQDEMEARILQVKRLIKSITTS